MTEHDVLVGFRLRLFTLAEELGNVSAACRAMGVHRSTYYRLKSSVDRWGLEGAQRRERRRPRMPNEIGPTSSSGSWPSRSATWPGPRRSRPSWRGEVGRHPDLRARRLARAEAVGTQHPQQRLALVARHRDPYERKPLPEPPAPYRRHEPGEKVQLDCFYVGRLSGTKGTVWQYTAIDVASAYGWAELRTSQRNPALALHPRAAPPRGPRSSTPPAGSCARSPPTTAPSSARASSVPSRRLRRASASSRPAARTQRLRRAPPADDPGGGQDPRLPDPRSQR